MKQYIELTLLSNNEISLYFIWQKLYQQVHLALVEQQDGNGKVAIGASFPEYLCDDDKKHYRLGSKLRLFAQSSAELEALNINQWLSRLTDYMHISSIKPVLDSVTTNVSFYRVNRLKSNVEKARINSQRLSITFEQALEKLEGRSEKQSNAPYIRMTSLSSYGQSGNEKSQFRLVIGKKETDSNGAGERKLFNTYGLSKTATVPWF